MDILLGSLLLFLWTFLWTLRRHLYGHLADIVDIEQTGRCAHMCADVNGFYLQSHYLISSYLLRRTNAAKIQGLGTTESLKVFHSLKSKVYKFSAKKAQLAIQTIRNRKANRSTELEAQLKKLFVHN